jgi:hypothetical protein
LRDRDDPREVRAGVQVAADIPMAIGVPAVVTLHMSRRVGPVETW